NRATRRCTKPASPVTSPPKIATTFSLTTRLRPERKHAPMSPIALSGHRLLHCKCPLLGVKRTSFRRITVTYKPRYHQVRKLQAALTSLNIRSDPTPRPISRVEPLRRSPMGGVG